MVNWGNYQGILRKLDIKIRFWTFIFSVLPHKATIFLIKSFFFFFYSVVNENFFSFIVCEIRHLSSVWKKSNITLKALVTATKTLYSFILAIDRITSLQLKMMIYCKKRAHIQGQRLGGGDPTEEIRCDIILNVFH